MTLPGGHCFASHDPATGQVIASVSDSGADDARAAVDAAADAFVPWSRTTAYQRSDYLYRAYTLMLERQEALAKLMTEEQGKPIRMARNEVRYAADFLLWFAEEAKRVYGETIPSSRADQRFIVLREPVRSRRRHHPVELPHLDDHPQGRAGAGRRLHDRASSRPNRPHCAPWRCSRSSRTAGIPPGVVNLVTQRPPRSGGSGAAGRSAACARSPSPDRPRWESCWPPAPPPR